MSKIAWGIIGCGAIAVKFLKSMRYCDEGSIIACASRTPQKASEFSKQYRIANHHDHYEDLLARDDIDVVYIATTHNFHFENCLQALNAGKAVLCEKPFAINRTQALEMVATARKNNCFLMEGMWTRFLPAIRQVVRWIDQGEIGSLKMIRADFCFRVPVNPENRLFNPKLAGGALLDVGVYPVSFVSMLMKDRPEKIVALADQGSTGVDEQSAYVLSYSGGRMAILSSAIRSSSENRAEIVGTKGRIILPKEFYRAWEIELHRHNGEVTRLNFPFDEDEGFAFEINAVHQSLNSGLKESNIMPLDETLLIVETMDRIQASFIN